MQTDNIIKKAQQLGLNTGDGSGSIENIEFIAEQLGITDINIVENELDKRLNEQKSNNIYNNYNNYNSENNSLSFGEKEYNQARDENGRYDNKYYANRGKELDEKVSAAEEEKNKDYKKTDDEPIKEDGSNTKGKNKFDKLKDNINLRKAKNERFQNKLNGAKAKAYQVTHPGEMLKDKAEEKIDEVKDKAKDVIKNKVKKSTKEKVEKEAKVKVKDAVIKFVMKNPYVVLAIVGVILIVIILLLIFAAYESNENSSSNCTTSCDGFSIKETSLSEEEFVSKVQAYFSTMSTTYASEFSSHASDIYRIAISKNINPEMVIVRAISEGFTPGSSKNNYWGLGCYNGIESSTCISYSSFEAGVEAYCDNISQYDDLIQMMSKYAYIGDYWFNPGSWGAGGCAYFEYIQEYMSPSRVSQVSNYCGSSAPSCEYPGGSWCLKTTDEDQEAYAKYQVYAMAIHRQTVFGLEPNTCASTCSNTEVTDNWTHAIDTTSASMISTSIMTKPIYELITESEYNALNNTIMNNVISAGVGTRSAIVAAGVTPIKYFAENHGVVIPYTMCGLHGCSMYKNGSSSNKQVNNEGTTFYGVDSDWGTYIGTYIYGQYGPYYYYGPDCSGWVPWVFNNAGIRMSARLASDFQYLGVRHSFNSSYEPKPGDILESSGHVTVVVGVDNQNKKYYISEAKGGAYGTVITEVSFNSPYYSSYWFVDMSEYIENHKIDAQTYKTRFENGVLNYK